MRGENLVLEQIMTSRNSRSARVKFMITVDLDVLKEIDSAAMENGLKPNEQIRMILAHWRNERKARDRIIG
jgi:hypothetical protein